MDDLTSKIAELLQSPDGMEKVKSIASSLLANNEKADIAENKSEGLPQLPFSPDQFSVIMKMSKLFKDDSANDKHSKLLIALKPHLNDERQKRVDNAIKILKLIKMWPLIQESGIISML